MQYSVNVMTIRKHRHFNRVLISMVFIWLCQMIVASCGSSTIEREDSHLPRARNGNLPREGLPLQTADIDLDGRADQWIFLDEETGLVTRVERDIDFDGRVDLYEHFDETGQLVEEEMNLDFDNQIDVIRHYRDGLLIRRELAIGFDGSFALTKYYDASGQVLRVERDSDGDAQIDVWEYFDSGEVVQVGRDEDGDGIPEILESAE